MRAFLRVVLFLVTGPFVGLLAVSLGIGSHTLLTQGSLRDFTYGWDLLAPGVLIVSYSVGGFPALLTGVANVFIARWRAGWIGWMLTALVGGVISFAGMWVLFGPPRLSTNMSPDWQLGMLVALAGAVAGLVCAALFDGLTALLRRPASA
jgi:hypothetical protein